MENNQNNQKEVNEEFASQELKGLHIFFSFILLHNPIVLNPAVNLF